MKKTGLLKREVETFGLNLTVYGGWMAIALPQGQRLHLALGEPIVEAWHAAAEMDSYFGHDDLVSRLSDAQNNGVDTKVVFSSRFARDNVGIPGAELIDKLDKLRANVAPMYRSPLGYRIEGPSQAYLISCSHILQDYSKTIDGFLRLADLKAKESTAGEPFSVNPQELFKLIMDNGGMDALPVYRRDPIVGKVLPDDKFHIYSRKNRYEPYFQFY